MIIENSNGKFNAKVYDKGFIYLCELVNGEWKNCEFETKEEAQKSIDNYNERKKNQ